ncbi:tyrosine--tRNA ligase [Candidatus Profftella armatura]|uniref:tyrosine--tRNA ligase n=1 Tax=Candidatus Profftella armatura TaxID=669502 RepID=UPI0006AD85D1|nr:tyrosine--tRNA ligase [Candidatus Profftella armatura]ALC96014.1 tyrosine--tRNA ligase [Candidatus Profftella armatura]
MNSKLKYKIKNNSSIKPFLISDKIFNSLEIIKNGTKELLLEEELIKKLIRSENTNKPLRIKLGFDPTSPDIHLGHIIVLDKLHQLQNLGHQVIFLVGDFTAIIGDPTGKNITRPLLTDEQINFNAQTYFSQISLILDIEKTKICYNSKWCNKLSAKDIIKLTSCYNVARMMERDDFTKRYKNGISISIHEFLYPLIQGYDSVALKSDLELGGVDQKFNLLVAREIQRNYFQEPQCTLTMPLLEGLDGIQKMSKSKDNYIGITEPSNIMFAKIMSISDSMMWRYYELILKYSLNTISNFKTEIIAGKNPRDFKIILAKKIVTRFHSKSAAKNALYDFIKRSKGEIPDNIPELEIHGAPFYIGNLLKKINLCPSISSALRMIEQRGIRVNGVIISDKNLQLNSGTFVLQVGKRKFIRVKLL